MDDLGRDAIRTQWGLLGQWWCVPLDQTEDEGRSLCQRLREDMTFYDCPLDWIADRLYGGFACGGHPERRHVYFAIGQYSFLQAAEGRYWANDERERQDMWGNLLAHNADNALGDGPFTDDFPSVLREAMLVVAEEA